MQDLIMSNMEILCTGILSEIPEEIHEEMLWQWDSRFETALAQFNVESKTAIHAAVHNQLGVIWDQSNINQAPEIVKNISASLGNINSGQLLFTSDPEKDDLIYCAWWPWGNGETISIRVSPSYHGLSDSEKAEKMQVFKGWFGIK